jgi:transposase
MWRNYLDVVQEFVPNAAHVPDRLNLMKKFNWALDEIRREETRELRAAGYEPVLRKARWCLLRRRENLTDRQTTSLREILKHSLKTVRAWLSREDFQQFWEYSSPACAGKFLDEWTDRTLRTRLQRICSISETIQNVCLDQIDLRVILPESFLVCCYGLLCPVMHCREDILLHDKIPCAADFAARKCGHTHVPEQGED